LSVEVIFLPIVDFSRRAAFVTQNVFSQPQSSFFTPI